MNIISAASFGSHYFRDADQVSLLRMRLLSMSIRVLGHTRCAHSLKPNIANKTC